MICLPAYPPSNAVLRSFWVVLSSLCIAIVLAYVVIAKPDRWAYLPWGALVVIGLISLRQPKLLALAYRIWNKLAREFSKKAQAYAVTVCYLVIVSTMRLCGSRILRKRPAQTTLWTPHMSSGSEGYRRLYSSGGAAHRNRNWLVTYSIWVFHSGNYWALSLLPFIAMLHWLDTEIEDSFPQNLYTLF